MIDFKQPMPLTKLEQICQTQQLSQRDWKWISEWQVLSESFIEQYKDKLDWIYISSYQDLSEDFMEKFKDKVDWWYISKYQVLSESFIEKFKDELEWKHISRFQKLSDGFIKKYVDRIDVQALVDNWKLKPTELKKQLIINTGWFECHETYFVGYKKVLKNRQTYGTPQQRYTKGNIIFGLIDNIQSKSNVERFVPDNIFIIQCKIYYKDVVEILSQEEIVQCSRLTVLS